MQRAILLSLLTDEPSTIVHPAWSSEAIGLFDAAQQFGLNAMTRDPDKLVVTGVGRSLHQPRSAIVVAGSAFNFRTVAALACLVPTETVIEGHASMRRRPIMENLNFIPDLGARLADHSDSEHLRIRITGSRQLGGQTTIDTRHSSQTLTAVLLVAPLADRTVRIDCLPHDSVGEGYVDLTLAMMRAQGAAVTREGTAFVVSPSVYRSRLHHVASDFTALSYLAGAVATVHDGQITITGYRPSSLSSEQAFYTVLRRLGIQTMYDPVARALSLHRIAAEVGDIEIDGHNMPTVIPTLAAIAPFVDAKVSVRNVAHVNNHKSRRVEVMIRELTRLGCRITPWYNADGWLDGFWTQGPQRPAGGAVLDSHGDHRIFMSLATAALGARLPSVIDGAEHLHASFPDYLPVIGRLGARWDLPQSDAVMVANRKPGNEE
jgi:3-phosphoshikimate 1-carboxyvinyltransferase